MLCQRPQAEKEDLEQLVKTVFQEIENSGDDAVTKYTQLFDRVVPERIKLTENEIIEGAATIAAELKHAIRIAKQTITAFHATQKEDIKMVETVPGVVCWRESRPIERIGIYVPGGTAPLFSTVLMLAIPAKLAGCKEIILCSPPGKNGKIDNAILYAARIAGVSDIYCAGGIQAVAAMALGTQSIPKVDKIFGPGNQYVTAAKQMALRYGVAIDLPAGPSELLVIADNSANVGYVAADLLSQAEHGADSQVVLLTTDRKFIDDTVSAIGTQINDLPRKHIAEKALRNSKIILLNSITECIAFSNLYAPEHLIIASENAKDHCNEIVNAGSVFLGNYSCESAGDYASGTNHTLPTNGFAKSYSGVSLDSFLKKITFQELTPEALQYIGSAVQTMAKAEGLEGHSYAVTIRLNDLNNV